MLTEDLFEFLSRANALSLTKYAEITVLFLAVVVVYFLTAKTKARNVVKGILGLIVLWLLSMVSHMYLTSYFLERLLYLAIFIVVVVFAPELRHSLERVVTTGFGGQKSAMTRSDVGEMLNAVADAVGNLSRRRVGALICFEKATDLQQYVNSGIMLDALCSSGLLINIFEKNTPLHDGAVIVRNNRVTAATCYLPLTEQYLSKSFGTRHRAALGLSEESDALIVVVSEETGNIACARDGKLLQFLTPEDVMALMVEHLYGKENSPRLNRMVSDCFEK